MNFIEDLFPILFGIIFALIGSFVTIFHIKKRNLLSREGEQVIATITSIHGGRERKRAYSTMRIGDDVELYINKDDPKDYVYAGNGPIVLGVIFIVIGIFVPLFFYNI